ncbi:MAG TPA: bifunctional hydroxymethylpyrimidine kinase/phosphomethylpyrimidine kinase [Eoetvoesiella sp.]
MISHSVQPTSPTLILVFGPFDPSGSSCLPADAITVAALGGHALSTVTALHVQDTAGIEDIQTIGSEIIDDQARCLLEDMPVQAIKVGALYTAESVSVLAQIAADYSHVPLVLHLGALPDQDVLQDDEAEDVLAAVFELLLPQTDIVLAEHNLLAHWQTDGLLPSAGTLPAAQTLLQCGAQWVLTTGSPLRPGHSAYLLQGPDQQTLNWAWQAPAIRLADPDGPLACALTLQLAQGVPVPQAVEQAILQSAAMATRNFQPGMGLRLINRSA